MVLKLGSHGGKGFRWGFQVANFSTESSGSNVMVDYLVTSLGFSEEEAIATSSKVRTFKSPEKPASVIHFFKQSGLDQPQIKKIIYENPKVLSFNLHKVVKPRMKLLQDLGLSGSDLAMAICANREIWKRSLNCQLIPMFQYLKTIVSDKTVSKALTQFAFLTHQARGNLPSIIALLQDYVFSNDKIEKLILEKPRVFVMDPKRVHDVLVNVENKLQIPRDSPRFFFGFRALISMSEKTIESKIEAYKSFGFTEGDAWTLAGKIPANLQISETKIRNGLRFYMKVLGFDANYMIAWPILLCFSVEKRVIPRWTLLKGLKEKGLVKTDYSLGPFLAQSERIFVKFVLRFKEKAPDLCEDYFRSTGSHLHPLDAEQTPA